MRLEDMKANELSQFSTNLATNLAGTELSAIESHVRADIIAQIGTLPDELMAAEAAAQASQATTDALFATRDQIKAALLEPNRRARGTLTTNKAPKSQVELAGFTFSDGTRSTYVAQRPTDLSVEGFSHGVNEGKFSGNNKSSSVTYEIWRRQGDTEDFGMHDAIRTTKFTDENVTPGQYYEYKVRAKASKTISQFSNSATVYGQGKPSGAGGGS